MMSISFDVKNDVRNRKVIANSHFYTDCKSAAFRFDGSNPSSPTRKSPNALHSDFFSYIRLAASSIGFAQCFGEYNITSAQAEISPRPHNTQIKVQPKKLHFFCGAAKTQTKL